MYPPDDSLPAKLAEGRLRFERWRSEHKPRTRLPEPLWSLATELAREFGLNRIASLLRLNYYDLKKRLEQPAVESQPPAASKPSFLEVLPTDAPATIECTIECKNASGTQIHIQVKGRDLPDLATLCNVLWSGHP